MSQSTPATLLSRRFPGKRAFITGAASGLGFAMAQALGRDGWTLGLLDLSAPALERASAQLRHAGIQVAAFAGDVSSAALVTESIEAFAASSGGLDLIINNAGVAVAGAVEVTPIEDWRWIVDINLLGVVWGCRAALPIFHRSGSGLILNIASSAGFAAAPQMAAYNVTKAGVIALSETLAAELAGSNIQVSCAMPGFFRTHLLDTMRAPAAENTLARTLMDGSGHDPDEAAAAILGATATGEFYVIWPPEYRTIWRLKRFFPRWFLRRVRTLRDAQVRKAGRPRG